jgi:hypothetical protein
MYNLDTCLKIIKNGLTFEEYIILCILQDGALDSIGNYQWDPIKLIQKGYLFVGNKLTPKAEEMLKSIDYKPNFVDLHKRLQNKLISIIGKKQVQCNGGYTFLCNSTDLQNRLSKVIKKYKLSDMKKVEDCLFRHIDSSKKKNFEYVQTMAYYIEKDGNSSLVTDYENFNENFEIKKQDTFDI